MSDTPTEIVWEDPAPRRTGRGGQFGIWIERLSPLLEHPGRWAVVLESETPSRAYGIAHNLSHHRLRVPPGEWEYTARGNKVYARYLGPDEA